MGHVHHQEKRASRTLSVSYCVKNHHFWLQWLSQPQPRQVRRQLRGRLCQQVSWVSLDSLFGVDNSWPKELLIDAVTGGGRTCVHCMETDHTSQNCALAPICPLWHAAHAKGEPASQSSSDDNRGNRSRGMNVCCLWNDRSWRCSVPYCRYWYSCVKCSSPTHKAIHCNTYAATQPTQKVGTQRSSV